MRQTFKRLASLGGGCASHPSRAARSFGSERMTLASRSARLLAIVGLALVALAPPVRAQTTWTPA